MSPIEVMARYSAEHGLDDFGYHVELYLREGWVTSTPDYFVMLKREGNSWYVAAFAGDMSKAWSALPYELPFLSFHRNRNGKRELTRVSLTRIRRLSLVRPRVIHHEFGQSTKQASLH